MLPLCMGLAPGTISQYPTAAVLHRVSFLPRRHWARAEGIFGCYIWGVGAAAAKSLQSWPTLCDPIDGSPPGSPVLGILQARTLEWVAISFSNA